MRRLKFFLVLFCTVPMFLHSHDVLTHMYIGWRTFDIWKDYDQEFYDSLTDIDPVWWDNFWTIKFYLLGLMLPDILHDTVQAGIRDVIYHFHNAADDLSLG